MTPEQITALWRAAQDAGLSAEQINGLAPENPYAKTGPVARMMQSAIARVAPEIAQQFLAEAGTTASLKALAAQQGLVERTPAIDAELAAFNPKTPEQAKADRIAELQAMCPFGTVGSYSADGTFVPGKQPNLTAALELQSLDPDLAASLKAAAQPPVANPGALTAEGAAYVNSMLQAHGGSVI